ncbi:MAG: ATP-binding protein [Myxococcota bacterium]
MTTLVRDEGARRKLVEDLLRAFSFLMLWVAVPAGVVIEATAIIRGPGTALTWAFLGFHAGFGLLMATARQSPARVQAPLMVAYALGNMAFSFAKYGPSISIAPMMVAAGLFAGLLFGRRGAWGLGLAVTAIISINILAVAMRWHSGPSPASMDFSMTATWVRKGVVAVLGVGGTGWLVLHLLGKLEGAVADAEAAARASEEERSRRVAVERELDRVERLEMLGRLASAVGREVSDALDTVVNAAEADANDERGEVSTDRAEVIRDIVHAATSARATAGRLAALDATTRHHSGSAVLSEAVREEVERLAATGFHGVRLETDLETDRRVGLAPDIIHRLVRNLCLNARDASETGDRVEVRVRPIDEGTLAGGARVIVVDRGRGMAAEELECLFQPFFSTKGELGTGLGLAEVHRMVTSVGGNVKVTSELCSGTTISLNLPPCTSHARFDHS